MQLVREVEGGKMCSSAVARKYNLGGPTTVMRWVRQSGSGKYGKVIRVEKGDEVDEASRLRKELRRVKEALADAHVELALEKGYLEVACEELEQSVEAFKKNGLESGAQSDRGEPRVESALGL